MLLLELEGIQKVGLLKFMVLNHLEKRHLHYMQLLSVKKLVELLHLLMLNMPLIDFMQKNLELI